MLVSHFLEHTQRFGLQVDAKKRKVINNMKREGILPCEELLLAACEIFNLETWVHHVMLAPVM